MRLHVVPWALEGLDLGPNLLELGPGYGASTDLLLPRCESLTCVESDQRLARNLRTHAGSPNMAVLCGDAAALPIPDSAFNAAVCFMMLHHVTPAPRQDQLFAEAFRVLRPGGIFAGADSPASPLLTVLHLFEKVSMVDPHPLPRRLEAAGFEDVQVDITRFAFRFRARKPLQSPDNYAQAAQAESSDLS
ncbi:MAG TPA: class I SAM-dependent methyltransferase, partial [Acidobacteriaceae bacterium]|nr:class I SAM-dependent methyltransferase [Acidobacteriaceae bacterium]